VAAGRTGELGEVRSLGILPMWRAASRPVAGGAALPKITGRAPLGARRRAMSDWLEIVGATLAGMTERK
jgi:hypothetical protein